MTAAIPASLYSAGRPVETGIIQYKQGTKTEVIAPNMQHIMVLLFFTGHIFIKNNR